MEKFLKWLLKKNITLLVYLNLVLAVISYFIGIYCINIFLFISIIFIEFAFLYMAINENWQLLKEGTSLLKIVLLEFAFVYFNCTLIFFAIFYQFLKNLLLIIFLLVISGIISVRINKVVIKYL